MTRSALAEPPVAAPGAEAPESLFPEARRRQRRRWVVCALVAATLIGAGVVVVTLVSAGGPTPVVPARAAVSALPVGGFASLGVAGALAVGPDGGLYVADPARHRVLLLLPGGRFRVIAGDGRAGFTGDGGPAVRAELSNVNDLAFGPGGVLYIADGRRVREVDRRGVIRTVVGPLATNDPYPYRKVWIAVSPTGALYVSTGLRIARVGAGGRLDDIPTGALNGWGPIAVDRGGDVYVGSDTRAWSIWRITPGGTAHYYGFARRSGGDYPVLQIGPRGAVYGENGPTILRLARGRLTQAFGSTAKVNGQIFPVTYFAFGAGATMYADDLPGNDGFETRQEIVSVSRGSVRLLWEER